MRVIVGDVRVRRVVACLKAGLVGCTGLSKGHHKADAYPFPNDSLPKSQDARFVSYGSDIFSSRFRE